MKDRIMNLLLMLVVAAALGVTLLRSPADTEEANLSAALTALPAATAAPDPLDAYRARRREDRAREQAALLALMGDAAADEAARQQARQALAALNESAEAELAVEAALAVQGDGKSLCVVRNGEATVLLSQPIDETQAALILELAREASGLETEKIRIAAF